LTIFRTIFKAESQQDESSIKFEETSCGHDSFRRGAGQKIVGFSFYGDINSER